MYVANKQVDIHVSGRYYYSRCSLSRLHVRWLTKHHPSSFDIRVLEGNGEYTTPCAQAPLSTSTHHVGDVGGVEVEKSISKRDP